MKTVQFFNYSTEVFTFTWDKEPITIQPGQKIWLMDWLAAHGAKHLANRELIKRGFVNDTSPKDPNKNENFLKYFNMAFLDEGEKSESKSSLMAEIDVINKQKEAEEATALDTEPALAAGVYEVGTPEEAPVANEPVEENIPVAPKGPMVKKTTKGKGTKAKPDKAGDLVIEDEDFNDEE